MLVDAVDTFELLESYPEDKYLPSFLVRGESGKLVFHALIGGCGRVQRSDCDDVCS
jgi:hypothetical protein